MLSLMQYSNQSFLNLVWCTFALYTICDGGGAHTKLLFNPPNKNKKKTLKQYSLVGDQTMYDAVLNSSRGDGRAYIYMREIFNKQKLHMGLVWNPRFVAFSWPQLSTVKPVMLWSSFHFKMEWPYDPWYSVWHHYQFDTSGLLK